MTTQVQLIEDCKIVFLNRLNQDYNIIIDKNDIVVLTESSFLKLQYQNIWSVFTRVVLN